jgi:hypothetical protein
MANGHIGQRMVETQLGIEAYYKICAQGSSFADPDQNPDPDLPDPHVFGPPGSGSISQRYGSGSFYHQAKIV